LEADVEAHLAHNYGDRAIKVADIAAAGRGKRIHPDHPYLEAEIFYAAQQEYARNPVDVLSRRTRLAFVDSAATAKVLPRVTALLGEALGWSPERCRQELEAARAHYRALEVQP